MIYVYFGDAPPPRMPVGEGLALKMSLIRPPGGKTVTIFSASWEVGFPGFIPIFIELYISKKKKYPLWN